MASSFVPGEMLESALAYARMGWRVFPLHTMVDGRCSCGKQCSSPAKHPRTKAGFKDASDDPEQIRKWWDKQPGSNIGIATGSGLVVIDIDGPEGAVEFKELVAAHGAVPETLVAQTGNGYHLFYLTRPDSAAVRSSARGKVHARGENGYVVASPSQHYSGRQYKWIRKNPISLLPEWLRKWSQGYEIDHKASGGQGFDHLGPVPAYLQTNQASITERASEALKTVYSASEEMRLKSALSVIPSDQYEIWFQVGMALKDLGWERSDGTDIGLDLWIEWSETCEAKFSYAACAAKWASFRRSGVTLGTVYHLAQQHGWNGGAPAPLGSPLVSDRGGGLNGTLNGAHALPAAFQGQQPIFFPDLDKKRRPRPTMTNAKVAILALGLQCKFDLFHNRMLVAGEIINKWNSAELSDHVVQMIRDVIRYRWGFDPNKVNVSDACEILALAHRFDPVLDYLDSLTWDGVPRLDRWLVTYLGAADTELTCAIGRLALIAAVRRAEVPGTKFDQIIVFEGPQGQGKSEAIEILAGAENFSDQSILGVDDRKQQELTEGVWLYEIGELNGLRRAEIEHVKAFASRKADRARPAYGRYSISQPRRTVFFASTNRDDYLQDETGNRRFWPVAVSRIDLAALRCDRDQIWAEACVREAEGCSHFLPERLWKMAGEEQENRVMNDEWSAAIDKYLQEKNKLDVSIMEVLVDNQFLQIEPGRVGRPEQMRAGAILRRMGMLKYRKRLSGNAMEWRYRRA